MLTELQKCVIRAELTYCRSVLDCTDDCSVFKIWRAVDTLRETVENIGKYSGDNLSQTVFQRLIEGAPMS